MIRPISAMASTEASRAIPPSLRRSRTTSSAVMSATIAADSCRRPRLRRRSAAPGSRGTVRQLWRWIVVVTDLENEDPLDLEGNAAWPGSQRRGAPLWEPRTTGGRFSPGLNEGPSPGYDRSPNCGQFWVPKSRRRRTTRTSFGPATAIAVCRG